MKGHKPKKFCRNKVGTNEKTKPLLELGMVQKSLCNCEKGQCKQEED